MTSLKDTDELKARPSPHPGHSQCRQITQDHINQFADTTNDHQWIQVDVERARCPHPAAG